MSVTVYPADPLVRRPHARGLWFLHEALRVVDGKLAFTVPAGFASDLASIPRPFRGFIETSDLGLAPAFVHDCLYSRGGLGLYDRRGADRLFLDLMATQGVPAWRRYSAYWAVRLFGKRHWRW